MENPHSGAPIVVDRRLEGPPTPSRDRTLPWSAPPVLGLKRRGSQPQSTPVRQKASCLPISEPPPCYCNDSTLTGSSSTSKRRRLNSQVQPLLRAELLNCTFRSFHFLEQFQLINSITDIGDINAQRVLEKIVEDESLAAICAIRFNVTTSVYTCLPRSFSGAQFPQWFCKFANAVLMADLVEDNHSRRRRSWVVTKDHALICNRNETLIRPDFILTTELSTTGTYNWGHVLVVGEHESKGSHDHGLSQLASYAEQVFIAQPFRVAVLGLITSNSSPVVTFWSFDRAGAIGSANLNYRSTGQHLDKLVRCLHSMSRLPINLLGFHLEDLTWDSSSSEYPLQEATLNLSYNSVVGLAGPASPSSPKQKQPTSIVLKRLLFNAPGLVGRGTRVWEGFVSNTSAVSEDTSVAVKFSWRNTLRTPESSIYELASSKGVVGIPSLIHSCSYGHISNILRPGPFTPVLSSAQSILDTEKKRYDSHIACHDRMLTVMVLAPIGTPISKPTLTPVEIAQALLAGLFGHASLFFQAGILHRDLSPNNIIALKQPIRTALPTLLTQNQTHIYNLYGCLIDLDYAIDTHIDGASGAADRTGTYPFIAINVLTTQEIHRYRHDLESFLYVLLWVCCYPVQTPMAPSTSPHQSWPHHDPLGLWRDGNIDQVASDKSRKIVSQVDAFNRLLERFRPGFEAFKQAARELRLILWATPGGLCALIPERGSGNPAAEDDDAVVEGDEDDVQAGEDVEEDLQDDDEPQQYNQHNEEFDLVDAVTDGVTNDASLTFGQEENWRLGPEEVRVGVSNLQAFKEVTRVFGQLISRLKQQGGSGMGQRLGESKGGRARGSRKIPK
ncbi:hypothetical protein BGX38DRAFT_1332251 [Terfezia claveryi]|nr:hypothetical protein BGX38DRAFT_1332251 [Terfezia claveryi]